MGCIRIASMSRAATLPLCRVSLDPEDDGFTCSAPGSLLSDVDVAESAGERERVCVCVCVCIKRTSVC